MLKSKKTKIVAICFIALLISLFVTVILYNQNNKPTVIFAEDVAESYAYGSSFQIPKLYIEVGGKQVEASASLRYPNGKTFEKDSYALNEAGEYSIIYKAVSDGKTVDIVEKTFVVHQTLITISDFDSTAEYVADPENTVFPDLGAGLNLSVYSGGWVRFNKPVDLNTLDGKSPISMYVVPKKQGVADFKRLIVRLTDVEDASNYVDFYCNYDTAGVTYTGMQAGAYNQEMTGRVRWYYPTESRWVDYLSVGSLGGQPADFSFIGTHTTSGYRLYNLQLNLETKEVYMQGKKIIDLDDPLDFETIWEGFTNNKVYVSLSAELVNNVSANLFVTNVEGLNLSDLIYEDKDSPEIQIDLMGYDRENLPFAVAGKSYVVFDAECDHSVNGDGLIKKVFYNYGNSATRYNVDIEDGRFKTDRTGIYTIEYTATDLFGNTTTELVNIACVASASDIVIDTSLCRNKENAFVGEIVPIDTNFSVSGGSGAITSKIEVMIPSGETKEVKDSVQVTEEGEYFVIYSATDMAGQTQNNVFSLNVTYGSKPVFNTEPELDKYYLVGKQYTMAPYYGYLYSASGKTEKLATAYYKVNGGSETAISSDGKFTISTNEDVSNVTFIFRADGVEKVVERRLFNFVVDGKLNMLNYFDTFGGAYIEVPSSSNESLLVTKTTKGNGGFVFVNPLLIEGFSAEFKVVEDCYGFDGFDITLTDKYNGNQRVTAKIINDNGSCFVVIENKKFALTQRFAVGSNSDFNAVFQNGYLIVNNDAKAKITKYDDGTAFNGFDSGFVYLSLKFNNVKSKSSVRVLRISGQGIDPTITEDEIKPSYYSTADNSGTYDVNTTFTVSKSYAGDVLDHTVSFTMTVTSPDGKPMVAIDGTTLKDVDPTKDYQIILSKSGKYRITYTVLDTLENKLTQNLMVTAKSDTEPTIDLANGYVTTATIGATVKIASATSKDENGNEVKVYAHVIDTDGTFIYLGNKKDSFEANKEGIYRVCFIAQDDGGNMAFVQYNVLVK